VLVFWNVDKEALDCECMKFMLQPIIENAILHGILPKGEPGEIYINVFLEDEKLVFNVHDAGAGMEEAKMRELLEKRTDDDRMALGLRNVFERLWNIYGEETVGIEIDSQLDAYTDITIRQPCIRAVKRGDVP
jgi:two-component system sensor histidine kinase YesM